MDGGRRGELTAEILRQQAPRSSRFVSFLLEIGVLL